MATIELSAHARDMSVERKINAEWAWRTIVILDFDESGRVIGIELLNLSQRTDPDKLRILRFETT